jgi:hypothetical protein
MDLTNGPNVPANASYLGGMMTLVSRALMATARIGEAPRRSAPRAAAFPNIGVAQGLAFATPR